MTNETLGQFMRRRREELGMSIREVCRQAAKNPDCGRLGAEISSGYYATIENETVNIEKISMDFFWAAGVILGVDPLKLYALSRSQIPERLLQGEERDQIFKVR